MMSLGKSEIINMLKRDQTFEIIFQSGGLTINTRVDSCLGALITEISETCRDALSSGDSAVLAVPDHWTEAQCEEFKNIFEQVSKVEFITGWKRVFSNYYLVYNSKNFITLCCRMVGNKTEW